MKYVRTLLPQKKLAQKQRGVAILVVMTVVAVITAIGANMIARTGLEVSRARTLKNIGLMHNIGYAGERFAIAALKQELDLGEKYDSLDEPWNSPVPELPVTDGATISGCLLDLSGKLNINNLLDESGNPDPIYVERFRSLFDLVDVPVELVDALIDWIDTDSEPLGSGGAENDFYIGLENPYRAANQDMLSVTELRQLKGINEDPDLYDQLLPHISALPRGSAININTATREVLLSLAGLIDENIDKVDPWGGNDKDPTSYPNCEEDEDLSDTDQFDVTQSGTEASYEGPYESIKAFTESVKSTDKDNKEITLSDEQIVGLDYKSEYFLVNMQVNMDPISSTRYAILQRNEDGKSRVIWRSDNTL